MSMNVCVDCGCLTGLREKNENCDCSCHDKFKPYFIRREDRYNDNVTEEQKLASLKKVDDALDATEQGIKDGEQLYGLGFELTELIERCEDAMKGRTRGLMHIIHAMDGRRQVPLSDSPMRDRLGEQLDRMRGLLEKIREALKENPCEHIWVTSKTGHDLLSSWYDVACSVCKSSVLLRPGGWTALEYKRYEVQVKEDG